MADPDTTHLAIISPDEVLYEDDVLKLMVPGLHQDLAILPHHTPLYAQLKKGTILITETNGKEKPFNVEGGIMRVKANSVSILVDFEDKTTTVKQ